MKIVSWNIAGAHTFKGRVEDASSYEKEDLEYFISQLVSLNADIISLQESHTPLMGDEPPQAEIIARNLGYKFVINHPYFDRSHIKQGQRLSLAIISKAPVENSYFHLLPNPNLRVVRPNGDVWVTFDAGFLVVSLGYKGTTINVANCHMIPFHYFNRDFLEFDGIKNDASDFLRGLAQEPTLVTGDFNYNDLRKLLPDVLESMYYEAFEGIETAPERGQQDHILFSKHWNLRGYDVRKANSDHYLCVAELALK